MEHFLDRIGGAGMVLRDQDGAISFCSCRHLFTCTDALEAEMLATREGFTLALQWRNLLVDD